MPVPGRYWHSDWFGLVGWIGFYGTSTIVGFFKILNPVYIYIYIIHKYNLFKWAWAHFFGTRFNGIKYFYLLPIICLHKAKLPLRQWSGRPGFNHRLRHTKDIKNGTWYRPCLILSNIRYVSRVKWSNPGKGVAPSSTPQCCSYWKGSLLVALDYGRQLYFLLISI